MIFPLVSRLTNVAGMRSSLNPIPASRISFVDWITNQGPLRLLWYFARSCLSLCLQNEVVVRSTRVIEAKRRMVRCADLAASASGNGHNRWIPASTISGQGTCYG
jgi:hypothetical protein